MVFFSDNTYGGDKDVPIPFDTVLTINSTGHTINSWGKDLFFLPHMVTVDSVRNYNKFQTKEKNYKYGYKYFYFLIGYCIVEPYKILPFS